MPKALPTPTLPLNGLFPIAKPSGKSSMRVIDRITPLLLDSKLFDDPVKRAQPQMKGKRKKNLTQFGLKIGQGGTLDPLADGVLVLGVNRGTKHLNQFLECSKEYESIGLIGATTTSMDADDPVLSTAPWEHITREDVEKVLDRFRGEIMQVPPIFSALKMDGKPLYEYARESKPLPRPIPARKCQVSIELIDFTPASVTPGDGGHDYHWPEKRLTSEEKETFRKLTEIVHNAQTGPVEAAETSGNKDQMEEEKAKVVEPLVPDLDAPEYPEISPKNGLRPPTFTVRMTVSSGTYVRSIVNDIGLALGCGAHVVKLTRTRQGEFSLYGDEEVLSAASVSASAGGEEASVNEDRREAPGPSGGSIPWAVWERALAERDEIIKREKLEKEEAIMAGMSAEEIHQVYNPEAIKQRRWEGGWKEWEVEVLKRFKPVPVPINGGHGFRI
ncbi:tRNA pseudouridine(55) synthase [Cryptococcus neoformans]|nr:tRNA pseudouridine(55) synthase [Cryptococcus neoformans var. grubii]